MPLVNRTFDQLIDFTRTSAATFVNSSGNIASTPQSRNLFTFTQEFDNAAWTKSNVTISANSTAAPDGTMTADTATASASSSIALNQSAVCNATAATFSIYAKQGSSATAANTFRLRNSTTSTTLVEVTLNYSTGAITYTTGSTGASATSVGNGWWRVVITATSGISSGNTLRVDAGFAGTGATNDYCFLWGAQLEQASAATDYTRNFGGLFPPRFDYDPVTRAPRGLLIEEQRTNLLTYSEQFDNAAWTKGGATVTANSTSSPDGTVDADTLTEDTSTGDHRTFQTVTVSNTTAYAFSVFVKPNGRSLVTLTFSGVGEATYNVSTGVVTNTALGTAEIQNAGNGWYRCILRFTTATTSYNAQIRLVSTGTTTSYTGDGTSGIFIYGAQLEAGAFATSYIPTVASQVTRSADVAAINAPNFASWYNQSAGSFVVEFQTLQSGALSQTIYALALDTSGSKRIVYIANGGDVASTFDGTTIISASDRDVTGTVSKTASAYDGSGRAIVSNGGTVATGAVVAGYSTASSLNIGQLGGGQSFGWIRSVRYYPTRLSNAQLQALTA